MTLPADWSAPVPTRVIFAYNVVQGINNFEHCLATTGDLDALTKAQRGCREIACRVITQYLAGETHLLEGPPGAPPLPPPPPPPPFQVIRLGPLLDLTKLTDHDLAVHHARAVEMNHPSAIVFAREIERRKAGGA